MPSNRSNRTLKSTGSGKSASVKKEKKENKPQNTKRGILDMPLDSDDDGKPDTEDVAVE